MRTALLIEDDEIAARVFERALRRRGFDIIRACNAAEASEAFERFRSAVNLVVCDALLQSKTGPELIREFAAMQRGLRVLFTSGTPMEGWPHTAKATIAQLKR